MRAAKDVGRIAAAMGAVVAGDGRQILGLGLAGAGRQDLSGGLVRKQLGAR